MNSFSGINPGSIMMVSGCVPGTRLYGGGLRAPRIFFIGDGKMKRVCIFVDGENFRKSIVALFPNFNQAQYLPRGKWDALFNGLAGKVGDPAYDRVERVRTYWYVVDKMDFYPYEYDPDKNSPEDLKRLFSKYAPFKARLDGLSSSKLETEIKRIAEELAAEEIKMSHRFQVWTRIQEGIKSKNCAVEFRRAGAICYQLFDHQFGIEKAVDVKLATDLLLLKSNYDVAIIVSGDQDFVPAVEEVKNAGKRVINVVFRERGGNLLPGGAWRLNLATDDKIEVTASELSKYLKV